MDAVQYKEFYIVKVLSPDDQSTFVLFSTRSFRLFLRIVIKNPLQIFDERSGFFSQYSAGWCPFLFIIGSSDDYDNVSFVMFFHSNSPLLFVSTVHCEYAWALSKSEQFL